MEIKGQGLNISSHQFCYPVKWYAPYPSSMDSKLCLRYIRIETQDVILGRKPIETIIEIGPSNILTTLAKKVITRSYSEKDLVESNRKKFVKF